MNRLEKKIQVNRRGISRKNARQEAKELNVEQRCRSPLTARRGLRLNGSPQGRGSVDTRRGEEYAGDEKEEKDGPALEKKNAGE